MKILTKHSVSILMLFWLSGCNNEVQNELTLNYAHLNYLYKEINLPNGKQAGIIHIYSNYPNYNYDIEPKEGFTCVDDVARAVLLLSKDNNQWSKIVKLTEFLLYMQNENGWFNNFIWNDLSINYTYKTSVAEPSWWSWRALWALESALPVLKKNKPELAKRVEKAINNLIPIIITHFNTLPISTKIVHGITVPTQLPFGSATDQAAILTVGLTLYFERTKDESIKKIIYQLSDGILMMQIKNGKAKGAFLSWENRWHAYGNLQSYALLKAGKLLDNDRYIKAALFEIDNFYTYLSKGNFVSDLEFNMANNEITIIKSQKYAQIAYGIRPIIYACTEGFKQTGKLKYKTMAIEWLNWFNGKNIASAKMYNKTNGRCFDGIISRSEINKNSGAESTIEALLSIIEIKSIIQN